MEYAGDWGAPLRRAFCGNRFQFRDDFRLDDWHAMAPGVPFDFQRDGAGFAVEEMRMSKIALDWLSSHAPHDTFMLSKPPPKTALAALREQFDDPTEVALASWTTPVPEFPLAYDPQHPDQAMPAKLVVERRQGFWCGGLVLTLILAAIGIPIWRLGVATLTGQSGTLLWVLTLAPLLALPWWSDFLPRLVRHANKDWADVVTDMLDDVSRVTRFTASTPADALLARGERMLWHVEAGAYADTFGRVHFALPNPAPKSDIAALAALRAQTAQQLKTFDSARRTEVFQRLRRQYDAGQQDVQRLFTMAAEDTLRDAQAGAAAHKAARNFLIFASGATYYEDQLDKIEVPPQ